jgi:CheR methyltransferase, SAM binding domain
VLKFGICEAEELDLRKLSGPLGRGRFIAATLYPAMAASRHPDRDALLEQILARFPTRNASLKRTHSDRFAEWDRALVEEIRRAFPSGRALRVHDAGVSDGRTAVAFFHQLAAVPGLELHYLASDYCPDVQAVEDPEGRLAVVLDPASGELLQAIAPPFVFNIPKGESPFLFPVNHFVRRRLLATRVRDLLERHRRGDPRLRVSTIRLLHPSVLALAAHDPRFRFERQDLLEPAPGRFDVVRAMNVLNRSYFSDAHLARVLANIAASLDMGGLFAVGANQGRGSVVDGAIYQRTAAGFERRLASGRGSEIDALVLAARGREPR